MFRLVWYLKYFIFLCLVQMTEDSIIYQFSLLYTPSPVGGSAIVRTQPATINVECHYPRQALHSWALLSNSL